MQPHALKVCGVLFSILFEQACAFSPHKKWTSKNVARREIRVADSFDPFGETEEYQVEGEASVNGLEDEQEYRLTSKGEAIAAAGVGAVVGNKA